MLGHVEQGREHTRLAVNFHDHDRDDHVAHLVVGGEDLGFVLMRPVVILFQEVEDAGAVAGRGPHVEIEARLPDDAVAVFKAEQAQEMIVDIDETSVGEAVDADCHGGRAEGVLELFLALAEGVLGQLAPGDVVEVEAQAARFGHAGGLLFVDDGSYLHLACGVGRLVVVQAGSQPRQIVQDGMGEAAFVQVREERPGGRVGIVDGAVEIDFEDRMGVVLGERGEGPVRRRGGQRSGLLGAFGGNAWLGPGPS